MAILEDKGTNEIFEGDFYTDTQLKDYNYIVIFPLRKENNLFELNHIKTGYFYYAKEEEDNHKPENISILKILLIIFLSIIGIIIVIIFA